ncbi:MAG: DUF2953 domain-containing protein [Clostridiales bacterium]|nr:DUF2953 domain-containing protein [Clostridiales bacterium]
MIAVYILLGFLGILLLILLLPAGVHVRYDREGLLVRLVLGPVRWQLLPRRRKKKEKAGKKEQAKEKSPPKAAAGHKKPPEEQKKGGSLRELLTYVPTGLELLNAIRRSLVMRKLELLVNLGGDDPCDLALLYGKAWAGLGSIIPLLERCFRIRRRNIQVFCDFTAESTEIFAQGEIVACPARLLGIAVRYGWRLFRQYEKNKKTKKAVQ